jgi:hypothetical protein
VQATNAMIHMLTLKPMKMDLEDKYGHSQIWAMSLITSMLVKADIAKTTP